MGIFDNSLSEAGNPFSPLSPVQDNTVGNLISQAGSLFDAEFSSRTRQNEIDERYEARLLQASVKDAREAQQDSDDRHFMSMVYDDVAKIRSSTLQGSQSRLSEASRISKRLSNALRERPDLAKAIRLVDNDIAGIDASEVETEIINHDELLLQSTMDDFIKSNPMAISVDEQGRFDRTKTFLRAADMKSAKMKLEAAKEMASLRQAELNAQSTSLDIQQKQTSLIKADVAAEIKAYGLKQANIIVSGLLEHAVRSKAEGSYNPVEARSILKQQSQALGLALETQLTELGITDQKMVDEVRAATQQIDNVLKVEEFDIQSLQGVLSYTEAARKLNQEVNFGGLLTLEAVAPGFTRDAFSLYSAANTEATSQLVQQYLPNLLKTLSQPGVLRGSTPMSEEDAVNVAPAVSHILGTGSINKDNPSQTANVIKKWAQAAGKTVGENGEGKTVVDLIRSPEAIQTFNKIEEVVPELAQSMAPAFTDILKKGFKQSFTDLSTTYNNVATTAPHVQVVQNNDGTLRLEIDKTHPRYQKDLESIRVLNEAMSVDESAGRSLLGDIPSPVFPDPIEAIRSQNPSLVKAIENWNDFQRKVSKLSKSQGLADDEIKANSQAFTPSFVVPNVKYHNPFDSSVQEENSVSEFEPQNLTGNSNFDQSLNDVFEEEGGFVNHPKDPGGATNKGITKVTLQKYRGEEVTEEDVANLTDEEAAQIYKTEYWDTVQADKLPKGVDLAVFDFAVNSGPSRAVKYLQKIIGTKVDGIVGEKTLAELAKYRPEFIVAQLTEDRLEFLKGLKTWETFGNGWSKRVERVKNKALTQVT